LGISDRRTYKENCNNEDGHENTYDGKLIADIRKVQEMIK
jgi:hypothetical protein